MPRIRASVYNHFTDPSVSNTLGNCRATCMHCGISVSGSTKATSNFRRHLQRRHPEILQELDSQASSHDQQTMAKFMPEPELMKWRHCDPHQIQLNDQLVNFIANDLLPLSIVDSTSFHALMHVAQPSFNVPSRRYLSTILLPQQYAIIRGKLKSQVQRAKKICLSMDLWSSRDMRSFIGIMGHFILDYTQHCVMLGCRRLKGRHTAENILQMYKETVASYDIANKVSNIVTNNTGNMTKAFTLLPDIMGNVHTDHDQDEINHMVSVYVTDEFDYLPIQCSPCFAHNLQLVICESLEEAAPMKQIMTKASRLVGYCLKSMAATEGLEGCTQLQLGDATRWNNLLKMLQSIKTVPGETLAKLDELCKLTEYELKMIEELCEILKPFEEVMDRIDGEQIVTSSLVIACVRCLRQAVAGQKGAYKRKIVAILESSIEKRLSQYEAMEDFKLAATVDPRFKLDWCKDEEVQQIKDLLTNKVDLLWSRPSTDFPSQPPIQNKRSKMFSFMTPRSVPTTQPWPSSSAEVSDYLNQPCIPEDVNPLDYWQTNQHRYPILAQLACQYLSIPASSKPTERIFSDDGKVFRPETCNLSEARFEQLMLIRCNLKN